ncbi:hypothetical protein [Nocardioides sp. GCM10030258]|uniref:hypothetical protein n=1 Tax=unclassified Nocardioides TaxID=2615069 RepID=UPI00361795DA
MTATITINCPTWCQHRDNPLSHDIEERMDGTPIVDHTVDIGPRVWGSVTQEVLTGMTEPARIVTIDMESSSPGVPDETPDSLRELAATLTLAAEWLEQQAGTSA